MAKGEEQSVDGKHSPEQTCRTMTLQQEMSFDINTTVKKIFGFVSGVYKDSNSEIVD